MSKRDRRVAARTTATMSPSATDGPQTATPPDEQVDAAGRPQDAESTEERSSEPNSEGGDTVAEVIPLGIFDPFAEAEKRW